MKQADSDDISQKDQWKQEAIEHSKKLFKKAQKDSKKVEKKGVVYMSRVPPYMNPTSLRRLIESKFTNVERIYMEQEREHIRKSRVKSGGNRKMKYTEAWIEFGKKKLAKKCAFLLNNT